MPKDKSINFFPAEACRREGHKSQARMGDVKELQGIFADFTYEYPEYVPLLTKLGIQRAKRRNAKKRGKRG